MNSKPCSPQGMPDVHCIPTNVNMFIDEEVRTHEANGNTIFTPRSMGRRGSLPRRYFLRDVRLFLGQPRCAEARHRCFCTSAEVGDAGVVPRRPCGFSLLVGVPVGGGASRLERAGVVLGLLGSVVGLLGGVMDEEHGMGLWATIPHLGGGRILLYTGLTVVGVATLSKDAPRLLGALVLGSGALGWVSLLTDPGYSGILVSMKSLHVAFAALFCLSCVVWGGVLFREAS